MVNQVKINSIEGLKRWINDKPSTWSHIMAIRISLRLLIMIGDDIKKSKKSDQISRDDDFVISVFRACYLSWAAYKFPSRNIIAAAVAARTAATRVASTSISGRVVAVAVARTAAAAARAAVFTVGNNADVIYAAKTARAIHDDFWKQVVSDALWLETQGGDKEPSQATRLAEQPLWNENAPQSLQANWQSFKRRSFATDHGYQPWILWYEAVAPFDAKTAPHNFFSEDLIQRIATQSQKWWKRPALEINTDIARWLEEEEAAPEPPAENLPAQLTEALDQLPSQQPAPYLFDWRDGRMEVLPPEALPEDGGIAQDYLDETREKADSLFERLERTNTDPDIRRKVGKLLDVLTERVADLRPALVKSRSLSITALADAHNTPQDERELSAGVLADLIDLDLTAKELCASLPDLARQEIERLVDAMASVEDAETARSGLDAIRLSAEEAEFLGPAAQAALAGLSEDAAEPAAPALKKRRVALFMATVRNLLLKALRVPGMAVKAAAGALWRFMKDSGKEFRGLLVKGTAYGLLVAAGTAPIYFVATQTEAISVVARYAEGFKDIEQILKLAGRLKTPPE